jgi:hypothetical protein
MIAAASPKHSEFTRIARKMRLQFHHKGGRQANAWTEGSSALLLGGKGKGKGKGKGNNCIHMAVAEADEVCVTF